MGITAIKPVYDRSKKSYKVEVVTGESNLAGLAQNGYYVTDDVARTLGLVTAGACEWFSGLRLDAQLVVKKWLLAAVGGEKAPTPHATERATVAPEPITPENVTAERVAVTWLEALRVYVEGNGHPFVPADVYDRLPAFLGEIEAEAERLAETIRK